MQVPVSAVTFDAGQTLVELDTAMLVERLAERGIAVRRESVDTACAAAWAASHASPMVAGHGGGWRALMARILGGAGVGDVEPLIDWLWLEQPHRNLWRRPVPGMAELVDELATAGVGVAVISNSEGRVAELLAEIGWGERFGCVADSGRLGIEKPDPAIFAWTLERLGVAPPAAAVHVGDSWIADGAGARRAGLRAIWFGPHARDPVDDPDIVACADAAAVRAALRRWGAPI